MRDKEAKKREELLQWHAQIKKFFASEEHRKWCERAGLNPTNKPAHEL